MYEGPLGGDLSTPFAPSVPRYTESRGCSDRPQTDRPPQGRDVTHPTPGTTTVFVLYKSLYLETLLPSTRVVPHLTQTEAMVHPQVRVLASLDVVRTLPDRPGTSKSGFSRDTQVPGSGCPHCASESRGTTDGPVEHPSTRHSCRSSGRLHSRSLRTRIVGVRTSSLRVGVTCLAPLTPSRSTSGSDRCRLVPDLGGSDRPPPPHPSPALSVRPARPTPRLLSPEQLFTYLLLHCTRSLTPSPVLLPCTPPPLRTTNPWFLV